jgi:hypothetical protein
VCNHPRRNLFFCHRPRRKSSPPPIPRNRLPGPAAFARPPWPCKKRPCRRNTRQGVSCQPARSTVATGLLPGRLSCRDEEKR